MRNKSPDKMPTSVLISVLSQFYLQLKGLQYPPTFIPTKNLFRPTSYSEVDGNINIFLL